MFEAKTHLSDLVQRVVAGERFYITRRGQRVAELRPVEEQKRPLEKGSARHEDYRMAADFDAPLDDLADYQ